MKRYIAFAFNKEFDQIKGGWSDIFVNVDSGETASFDSIEVCTQEARIYAEKRGFDSIQIVDLEKGQIAKMIVKGWVQGWVQVDSPR